ncbi:MAG: caspase family protein [Bacteroidaceae bacterium]|nr:caspase family protein [Bacteroidaceae bacterium]
MKKIVLTLILLLATIATQAQTFYELQFTHPVDKRKYLGLMTYFSDERCKMRIVRADVGAKGSVMESEYIKRTEPKTRENKVGMMYYQPKNGRSMPTLLWWWTDFRGEDMEPEPQLIYDMASPEDRFDAISFKEKQLSSMTPAFVEMFYKPNEAEYKNLIAAAKKAGAQNKTDVTSKGGNTPTLRLLMVANTEVDDIGIACQQDIKNVTNEFRNIARVLEIPYEQTIVSETDFGKANVANAIENFKPGSKDIAVFVYSGHGFRFQDQKDYFPCIDLSPTAYDKAVENYTTMTDIYNAFTAKGARLNIVLSDCCNTKVGQEAPAAVSVSTLFSRASHSLDTDKLRNLFLGQGGNVWATAASPGEASWCSVKGGFFLLSFIESLRYQISTMTQEKPSWESLINLAIDEARKKTNGNGVPREQNGVKQVKTKSVQ